MNICGRGSNSARLATWVSGSLVAFSWRLLQRSSRTFQRGVVQQQLPRRRQPSHRPRKWRAVDGQRLSPAPVIVSRSQRLRAGPHGAEHRAVLFPIPSPFRSACSGKGSATTPRWRTPLAAIRSIARRRGPQDDPQRRIDEDHRVVHVVSSCPRTADRARGGPRGRRPGFPKAWPASGSSPRSQFRGSLAREVRLAHELELGETGDSSGSNWVPAQANSSRTARLLRHRPPEHMVAVMRRRLGDGDHPGTQGSPPRRSYPSRPSYQAPTLRTMPARRARHCAAQNLHDMLLERSNVWLLRRPTGRLQEDRVGTPITPRRARAPHLEQRPAMGPPERGP